MARPRTPIGTFGEISVETTPEGRARALTRFRDYDGRLRRVMATAPTPRAAERRLKELLAERAEQNVGQGELSPSSSFRQLVISAESAALICAQIGLQLRLRCPNDEAASGPGPMCSPNLTW